MELSAKSFSLILLQTGKSASIYDSKQYVEANEIEPSPVRTVMQHTHTFWNPVKPHVTLLAVTYVGKYLKMEYLCAITVSQIGNGFSVNRKRATANTAVSCLSVFRLCPLLQLCCIVWSCTFIQYLTCQRVIHCFNLRHFQIVLKVRLNIWLVLWQLLILWYVPL